MANGFGTGSPATTPDGVLAGALLATIRTALGDEDEATWSDSRLLGFLNEAVREYSQHRPRLGEATITTAAGEQTYALPWDAAGVISVRYEAGDGASSIIYRLGYKNRRFDGGWVYDFLSRRDLTTAPLLVLGFDPGSGGTLAVRYERPHDSNLTAASAVTVPGDHHHVLVGYVLFAAARQLQAREQANPTSSSSLLMSQLAANTRRLELAYLNALNRILTQRQGEGEIVSWEKR